MKGIRKETDLFQKTWRELVRKPAYFEKAGMNLQGSWPISKNLTRIRKEAGLFPKSCHEFAGKPAYFQKAGTNLQGSRLISKKLA